VPARHFECDAAGQVQEADRGQDGARATAGLGRDQPQGDEVHCGHHCAELLADRGERAQDRFLDDLHRFVWDRDGWTPG